MYRISADTAIVTTADIITPPVDDPYTFGQIAAANSISDVYAMGGRPVTCLNLVCFPSGKLPPEQLHGIVAGALDKITEAGAVLAGGHSVDDAEPKFGLAVTGVVHPEEIWRNVGARRGDALILTKPIGSGVLFNAALKGAVSAGAFDFCVETVTVLNRSAAEVFAGFEVHAATDITGFGLGGHGLEMARGGARLQLTLDDIPVMPEAYAMYAKGVTTGVNKHNRAQVEPHLRFAEGADPAKREILFDPQTSGGLLVALPESQAGDALAKLHDRGLEHAAVIGSVEEAADEVRIVVG